MNKKIKYIILFLLAIVLGLVGRVIINQSTLLVDTNTPVPDGFLPINDYVLVDKNTKEPVQKIKTLKYEYENDSYDYSSNLETTKGIDAHSSFEEFVDVYGDYVATYILCHKVTSDDYNDDINLNNIKVKTFYDEYIKTEKCNLDDFNININFSCYTQLNNVYYTQREYEKLIDNENFFWKLKINEFNLYFSYICKNYEYNNHGVGIFDYVSSSMW